MPLNAPAVFHPCQPIVAMLRTLTLAVAIAATSVCAQAQNPKPTTGDAQKVAAIVSGDKAKTQAYCDIRKLSEQLDQAAQKNDDKMADELAGKVIALEKSLGPEYLALMDGLQDLDPEKDKNLGQEIALMFGALDRQCTR